MGTRSLTFVYNDSGKPILNIYRQFDGYPSGHGLELSKILKNKRIVNGYSSADKGTAFNGMECAGASILGELKKEIGGIYVYSVDETDCGQDYEYHVRENTINVIDCYNEKSIFNGSWNEFYTFCLTEMEIARV